MDNTNKYSKIIDDLDVYDDDIFDLGGIDWLDEIDDPIRELKIRRERLEDFPDKLDYSDEPEDVSRPHREIIKKKTPQIFYISKGKLEQQKDQAVRLFGKRVQTRAFTQKPVGQNESSVSVSAKIGWQRPENEKTGPKIIRLRKQIVSDATKRADHNSCLPDRIVQEKSDKNTTLHATVVPAQLPSPVEIKSAQWPPKPAETSAQVYNIQWPPRPLETATQAQDLQWPPKLHETSGVLNNLKASALELLLKLSLKHPRLFPQDGTTPRPWMIGIASQIQSRYRVSGRVANLALNIYLWQNRTEYTRSIATGGARYDLDGMVCGQVMYQDETNPAGIVYY